ncbi:MAG: hypothetical protein H6704_16720 [Myxococcales bacterium]|nr:hypothetical protein [Myxococcales bacterium]
MRAPLTLCLALLATPALAAPPTGWWAQRRVVLETVDLPVLGDDDRRVISLHLWHVEGEAPRLRITESTCAVRFEGESMVTTKVPRAVVRGVPPTARRALLRGDRLVLPPRVEVRGARLPRADAPLPTRPDDAAVADTDGDGRPGVTVRVEGIVDGDIQLVQRVTTSLEGRLRGDRIDGRLRLTDEQVVLGASSDTLRTPPPRRQRGATFSTRRLAGPRDCAWLEAHEADVFED